MPIKFRCHHCKQLLGISRQKAGSIFDCPNCGRSIRVPQSDGLAEAPPPPKFNMEDDRLVQALEDLAGMATSPLPELEEPNPDPVVFDRAPHQVAAPKILQPLPTFAPIIIQPDPTPEPYLPREVSLERPPQPPAQTAPQSSPLLGMISMGIVAFGAGFLVSSFFFPRTIISPVSESKPEVPDQPILSKESISLEGRVSYQDMTGNTIPDQGARILCLPTTRQGDFRLEITGLRPTDNPIDTTTMTAALRAMGGDLATADAQGRYSLFVPKAGRYLVIFLSRYQKGGSTPPDQETLQVMGEYFAAGTTLPQELARHVFPWRYRAEGPDLHDHVFQKGE